MEMPWASPRDARSAIFFLPVTQVPAKPYGHFDGVVGWSNPFSVPFDLSTLDKDHYEPFCVDELNLFFRSPVFASGKRPIGGRGEAAFWFPIVAPFTDARRTEIAQLKLGDIRSSGQVGFIDFNNDERTRC